MEIIGENQSSRPRRSFSAERNRYIGIVLIILGVVWMLSNFGWISRPFFHFIFSWQMLLVLIGGLFLVGRQWLLGGVMVGLGVLFAMTDFFHIVLPLKQILLPLMVIVVGIAFLFQRNA